MKKLVRTICGPNGGGSAMVVTPGCEWVLRGEGTATERIDGARCAIINGKLYKFSSTQGTWTRRIREGSLRDDHYDGWWLPVDRTYYEDKWVIAAYFNTPWVKDDGEYIAVGPHFSGNPYGLDDDFLDSAYRIHIKDIPRTLDGIVDWLKCHEVAGVVFRKSTGESCCIDRLDLNLPWPSLESET